MSMPLSGAKESCAPQVLLGIRPEDPGTHGRHHYRRSTVQKPMVEDAAAMGDLIWGLTQSPTSRTTLRGSNWPKLFGVCNGPCWIRTNDLRIMSPLL
jgi:hypothetical protein